MAVDHSGFLRLEYLSLDDEEMKMWIREDIESDVIDSEDLTILTCFYVQM